MDDLTRTGREASDKLSKGLSVAPSRVVRGPWKYQPRPPAPPVTRTGGYWQWVEFTPCEDIDGDAILGDGGMVHIPCEVCGPYCDGPDCLCRETDAVR